jgi:hypothetical protein
MKFSEAMLLGLPEIRFTNTTWLAPVVDEGQCQGCLIGAALYAMGHRDMVNLLSGDVGFDEISRIVEEIWPWTKIFREFTTICPSCGLRITKTIAGMMTHLASHYPDELGAEQDELSAEQIADFIRKFEPVEIETPKCQFEPELTLELKG